MGPHHTSHTLRHESSRSESSMVKGDPCRTPLWDRMSLQRWKLLDLKVRQAAGAALGRLVRAPQKLHSFFMDYIWPLILCQASSNSWGHREDKQTETPALWSWCSGEEGMQYRMTVAGKHTSEKEKSSPWCPGSHCKACVLLLNKIIRTWTSDMDTCDCDAQDKNKYYPNRENINCPDHKNNQTPHPG